jgi:hypothetical protein
MINSLRSCYLYTFPGDSAVRHIIRLTVLIPALWMALPAVAPAEDTPAEKKLRARLLAGTSIAGKLSAVDADGDVKKFTVQVSNPKQEIDPDAKKKYDDLYKKYTTAVQQRNKGQVQQLGPQLQQAQAAIYVTKDNPIEFQFTGDKDIKVRRQVLPPKEVDGKKVAYTKAEALELKGTGADANLVGYAATLKDLEADQYVRVYLSKKTAAKKDGDDKETKDSKADKADGTSITMIVIIPPPAAPKTAGAPGAGANPFAKGTKQN